MIETSDHSAIVSAAGGLIAAVAAGIPGWSARKTNQQAGEAPRRTALRDIALAANDVVITAERVSDRSNELRRSYRDLAVFAGQSGGSREAKYIGKIEQTLAWFAKIADRSRP